MSGLGHLGVQLNYGDFNYGAHGDLFLGALIVLGRLRVRSEYDCRVAVAHDIHLTTDYKGLASLKSDKLLTCGKINVTISWSTVKPGNPSLPRPPLIYTST